MKRITKEIFALMALAIAAVAAPAQVAAQGVGDGEATLHIPIVTLAPFEKMSVEAEMDLQLVEINDGEQMRLAYDLGDSDPAKFKVEVRKGELKIAQSYNSRVIKRISGTLYYNKNLKSISIDRAKVKFTTPYTVSIANLKVDDSGSLEGEVYCDDLEIDVDSNATLDLVGRSDYLKLKAKSNAKVVIRNLSSQSVEVDVAHGAVIAMKASDRMKVSTSTSGTIKYWGEPRILRVSSKLIGGAFQKQD